MSPMPGNWVGDPRWLDPIRSLFLFLPMLSAIPLDRILQKSGFPGSEMIPPGCTLRSLLALKLFGTARHRHVMSGVLDQGLALFAGLNVIPKRSFLTEYGTRIDPVCYPELMRRWFDAVGRLGLPRGHSFDLDFHTIPFHRRGCPDREALRLQAKPASERDPGLPGAGRRHTGEFFCYANGELPRTSRMTRSSASSGSGKNGPGGIPKN